MKYTAVFIGSKGTPFAKQEGLSPEEARAQVIRMNQHGGPFRVELFAGEEKRAHIDALGVVWLIPPSSWDHLLEEGDFEG
jgi:hypothetical protein